MARFFLAPSIESLKQGTFISARTCKCRASVYAWFTHGDFIGWAQTPPPGWLRFEITEARKYIPRQLF